MRNLVIALCVAAFSATLLAANVAGAWKIDGDVYGNAVKLTCDLKQDGDKLAGKGTFADGKEVIVTGGVKEDVVTFEFDTPDQAYHLVFTGKLEGETALKGTIAVAGVEGTFTAAKQ